MSSRKLVALVVILGWFYAFLAALLNPVYTPPSTPTNPIMPFLTADIVNQLWPLLLVSFPFVVLAGQQIVQPSGVQGRQVAPQEFARIQARARATRERVRQEVGHQEQRHPRTTSAKPAQSTREETAPPIGILKREELAEELLRPTPKVSEPEFTPPPVASRGSLESESAPGQIVEQTSEQKEENPTKRIEELEAERAAIASLLDRIEDMKHLGTIQPELYDKLKKKYISELEKINTKMERIPLDAD